MGASIWVRKLIGVERRRYSKSDREVCQTASLLLTSHLSGFGGGAEFVFYDTVVALQKQFPQLDITAVFPTQGPLADATGRLGVRIRRSLLPWWSTPGTLAHLIPSALMLLPSVLHAIFVLLRLRPTIVVTNTMAIPSFAIAAKILGIPHFWFIHEFGKEDQNFRFMFGYRQTVRLISSLSQLSICCSQAVEGALKAAAPSIKTTVVYPAISDPPGAPVERCRGEAMRAVLIGRFFEAKGQQLAVHAIATARSAGADIELDLVGPGDQKAVRSLARRLDVDDLLHFHGATDDVGRYRSNAHIALMCSKSEAFGRVTVEAMRAGLPVCATDSGGTPEIVIPGVNGLLSDSGDSDALAANLMSLESDDEFRLSLATNAIETAEQFNLDRYGDEIAAAIGLR
jgi:glycosyltransferase involved in cell wall biosynthesis